MLSSLRHNQPRTSDSNTVVVGERFPKGNKEIYNQYFGKLLDYYNTFIDDVYRSAGCPIAFPVGTELIEKYLSGYSIHYIPFDNVLLGISDVEGCWELDERNPGQVNIYYNRNAPIYRQHYTKIHETIHFCQYLDSDFRQCIDEIYKHNILTKELTEKLVERITDRTTALYLMPERQFVNSFEKKKSIIEVAKQFNVSMKTAMYRLEECGIRISN